MSRKGIKNFENGTIQISATVTEADVIALKLLGDGQLSRGIRKAVELAKASYRGCPKCGTTELLCGHPKQCISND